MADKQPDLPSARVVGESASTQLGVAAERAAREQAIKQLLREKRMAPADQAELDDHLSQFRGRAIARKLVVVAIIGVALLLRALL